MDRLGVMVVVGAVAALLQFRAVYVEPRQWGAVCATLPRPLICEPRAALLWLQDYYLWGAAALMLGIWALLIGRLPLCIAAVTVGIAGVVNYNATWGMLGAALGVWSWITPRRDAGRN